MKLPEIKNLVAKHAQRSGAGRHDDKSGKKAARHKQKQRFRKMLQKEEY